MFLIQLCFSCEEGIKYPRYSIETIGYIPDSLKREYREWVKETVRAASNNMNGGDYEDADNTIWAAKYAADELFKVKVVGMRKEINDESWDDLKILPRDMNEHEIYVFDSLLNNE